MEFAMQSSKLRAKLEKSIDAVLSGSMSTDKAHAVKGLANAISGSTRAEVEVAKLNLELKRPVAEFGSLELCDFPSCEKL